MWLMTRFGFYSVTCARKDGNRAGAAIEPGIFQVRARVKAHLENLCDRFPALLGEAEIIETPHNDYRWRIFVARDTWCEIAAYLADDITYDNFKSECGRQMGDQPFGYTAALHDVWATMLGMQRRAPGTDPRGPATSADPFALVREPDWPLVSESVLPSIESIRSAGRGAEPRETPRSARPEAPRKAQADRGKPLPIEATRADLDLLPVIGEPMALVVVDGDKPNTTVGIIERPERWKSDEAAYAAAVQRKRLRLIAHPQFMLCGWDTEARKRCAKARITLVR